LIVFRSIGNLLQLCLSNLKSLASFSSGNQILHFSELSLEVQGGQDYFRFVEGTCIIALCLSSFSLSVLSVAISHEHHFKRVELYLLLISVFSLGENEEKF